MERYELLTENEDYIILGKPGSICGNKVNIDIKQYTNHTYNVFLPQIINTNSYEIVIVTKNDCATLQMEEYRRMGLLQKITYVLVHGKIVDIHNIYNNTDSQQQNNITLLLRNALNNMENVKHVTIVANYRSNTSNSGWITLLKINWSPLNSTAKLKCAFRKLNYPIVGRGANCIKLGSYCGTCLVTCGLSFPSLETEKICIIEKIDRLLSIGKEEEKSWHIKTNDREVELLALGVHPLLAVEAAQDRLPVSHYSGCKMFDNVIYQAGKGVFEPRASSICLVETVISTMKRNNNNDQTMINYSDNNLIVLDLGTGSGCLLLALMQRLPTSWYGLGVDISQLALDCAIENACKLDLTSRVEFKLCDYSCETLPLLSVCRQKVGVVICNPPYLPDKVATMNNMRHDPSEASTGGELGLDAYRWVANVCNSLHLSQATIPGAILALEVPGNYRKRHDQIVAIFSLLAPSLSYCGYGVPDAFKMDRCMTWHF